MTNEISGLPKISGEGIIIGTLDKNLSVGKK